MLLSYAMIGVLSILSLGLTAIVFAFIFSPKFRQDILAKDGEAQVLEYLSVQGAIIVVILGLFIGGLAVILTTYAEAGDIDRLNRELSKCQETNDAQQGRIVTLKSDLTASQQAVKELNTKHARDIKDLENHAKRQQARIDLVASRNGNVNSELAGVQKSLDLAQEFAEAAEDNYRDAGTCSNRGGTAKNNIIAAKITLTAAIVKNGTPF